MATSACRTCNKQFSKAEHLKRHERSHTRERPYRCHICHKSYARSDVLFRHCKNHDRTARKEAAVRAGEAGSISQPRKDTELSITAARSPNDEEGQLQSNIVVALELRQPSPEQSNSPENSSTHSESHLSGLNSMPANMVPTPPPHHRSNSMNDAQMVPIQDNYITSPVVSVHMHTDPGANSAQSNDMNYGDPNAFSTLTPPGPTANPVPQPTPPMVENSLDYLNKMFAQGRFEPHDLLGQQDGSEGIYQYAGPTLQSWWLPFDDDPTFPIGPNLGLAVNGEPMDRFTNHNCTIQSTQVSPQPQDTLSDEHMSPAMEKQFSRLQHFWVRRTEPPTKPMSTLWHELSTGGGLFGNLLEPVPLSTPGKGQLAPEWTMTSDTKQRVWVAFQTILDPLDGVVHTRLFAPDTLEIAYEQYIVHHHIVMPMIHIATFSPQKAPLSLLVAMCTIGLSVMGTAELNQLVCKIFPSLLKTAFAELEATSQPKTPLTTRIGSMMTSFFTLTLASIIGDPKVVAQNENLHVALLSRAKSSGLFSADQHPPSLTELATLPTVSKRWRVWGSIESIKRLALNIIQLDCWFASHVATEPFLRAESVNIMPICESSLFEARTMEKWTQLRPEFSQMDYPVVSACYSKTPKIARSYDMMMTLLMLLQHRFAAASVLLDCGPQQKDSQQRLFPWKIFREDNRGKALLSLTRDLTRAADEKDRNFDLNCAISWHLFCMSLCANLRMFETAAGRMGPAAVAQALGDISTWASTQSARRACLHAGRIFLLLYTRRVSDSVKLHSIIALFHAALVLGFYIWTMPELETNETYNLYDDIDWARLGTIGLTDLSEEIPPEILALPEVTFIVEGRIPRLAEFVVSPSHTEARKCWLHFASVMLGLGRWKSRIFSCILHIMCDDLSDVKVSNME